MGEWHNLAELSSTQGRAMVKTMESGRKGGETEVFCHLFLIVLQPTLRRCSESPLGFLFTFGVSWYLLIDV